jgi:maleylpyruvate isomerase
VKLFSYWRSSCAWRVRIALAHKQLAYEYCAVDLLAGGGEQLGAAYRAENPMAQVPLLVLEDGSATIKLAQSLAIIEYLEERWPEHPLLPAERAERALCRQLAEIVNSGIQPLQNLRVQNQLQRQGADVAVWLRHFIGAGLDALERAAPSGAAFLVGDQPTLADVCLVPQLYAARRFGTPLEHLSRLLAVEAACAALPSFQRAHPDVQPDAPKPEPPQA